MADIIIADGEFWAEANRAKQDAQNTEAILAEIVSILDATNNVFLSKGRTSDNLKSYTACVKNLQGKLLEAIDTEFGIIDTFIRDVDVADSFIYGM